MTGNYGVVILPDENTIAKAYEIAQATLPSDAEYVLRSGLLPHLTLYHAPLASVPVSFARTVLVELNNNLSGRNIVLDRVASFKGFFLFWYAAHPKLNDILRESHRVALKLSRFRDRQNRTSDVLSGKILTTPQELLNIEGYGHPWVADSFSPHITLGYDASLDFKVPYRIRQRWDMTIKSVSLARIGRLGIIEEIVDV